MNLFLNYGDFKVNLLKRVSMYDGIGYVFRFGNNYGASVVKHNGIYGHRKDLWELAVIKFDDMTGEWDLVYDTPITDDVEGYLTDENVRDLLAKIKEL